MMRETSIRDDEKSKLDEQIIELNYKEPGFYESVLMSQEL